MEGRRAVKEALLAGRAVDRLYVLSSAEGMGPLVKLAKDAGAVVIECDRPRLDALSETGAHQGVLATMAARAYAQPEDILARAEALGQPLFLVVCDGVEDERNLGAIIRCAEAAGAHGVVIPKRRSAGLSAVTAKASAGAVEHLPVARVPGIPAFLRWLKERQIWVYGTAASAAQTVFDTNFSGGTAIVLGSEGYGLARLTADMCDVLVSIPQWGRVGSLNVSAAAAIVLYQVALGRARGR